MWVPSVVSPSRLGPHQSLVLGLTVGFSLSLSLTGLTLYARDAWKRSMRRKLSKRVIEVRTNEIVDGVEGLIGNTPLVRIKSLSTLLGVEILGKCEFMNPFGSVKDRVSLKIIQDAEDEALVNPHTDSVIFEGTSGSTGISIAGIARSRGYKAHIIVPDDVAFEKIQLLESYGATVEKVRPVSIVDQGHCVNLARQRALDFNPPPSSSQLLPAPASTSISRSSSAQFITAPSSPSLPPSTPITTLDPFLDPPRALFANQFENLSNLSAHYTSTGPEIWRQTSGIIDAFVSGSGTGGTISGVGKYLKECNEKVQIVLSDPMGSGLFHKVVDGVMYSSKEQEGKRRRYQVDTIVEGIGLNRLTANFSAGLDLISDAYSVTDEEAVAMSRYLALHDGLFLGSSAAVNLVACVRLALSEKIGKGSGKVIVTILCDSGTRHLSKFWNDDYLRQQGIPITSAIDSILLPTK